jgi:FkbM family methyltransferase
MECPVPLVDPTLGKVNDTRNDGYDEQTIRIIGRAVRPGDTCVDVGAHVGDVLKYMVAASDARHLAFEPLPELAAGLRRDFPSVDVHELALATEDGSVSFQRVATNPAYSGLLLRHLDRDDERVETITVQTRRLDDITDPAVPIRFIKIDVEGAELGVLSGGAETIQRDRPLIVFEHGMGAADVYGTRPHDIFDLFDGWGYSLTTMASWLSEPPVVFSRSEFVEQFERGINYYFMAMPALGFGLLKLNLGSGWDNREGYVNVDCAPHHKPDIAADVLNLPIAEGAIEEILAQDVLECLPRTSTTEALTEWRRVMEADGVARIRVPSLFHAVDLMRSADTLSMHETLLQNLYGTQAHTRDVHLTSFTDRTLADALHSAGYRRVSAELVDNWMWDITAWASDGQPLALFWGPGFYPEEGGRAPLDYQQPSPAWRWSAQDSSMSMINTGETCLRAILLLTLRSDQTPEGLIAVGTSGREWLCRVGEPAQIEISITPGERVEIAFHARLDRLDVGDPRELFFRADDSILRVEADSGPREPVFRQASAGTPARVRTPGDDSFSFVRRSLGWAASAGRELAHRAWLRASRRGTR